MLPSCELVHLKVRVFLKYSKVLFQVQTLPKPRWNLEFFISFFSKKLPSSNIAKTWKRNANFLQRCVLRYCQD